MADKLWNGTGGALGDASVAANYTPAGLPVNGDTLTVDGTTAQGITAGLAALAGVTLAHLWIKKSAPAVGTDAAAFQVGATLADIGEPAIDGTTSVGALVNLNFNAIATNTTVWGTAAKGTATLPPVRLAGSNAANKLTVKDGMVGVAVGFGSTANFPEVDIVGAGTNLTCGVGCSLATINQIDGKGTANSAVTTLNQTAGTFTHQGTGTIGTANVGGTTYFNSTGTITAINVMGTADLSGNPAARTAPAAGVIPIKAFKGSTVNINNGVKLSISATVQPQKCSADEITLKTWPDTTLAFS